MALAHLTSKVTFQGHYEMKGWTRGLTHEDVENVFCELLPLMRTELSFSVIFWILRT